MLLGVDVVELKAAYRPRDIGRRTEPLGLVSTCSESVVVVAAVFISVGYDHRSVPADRAEWCR